MILNLPEFSRTQSSKLHLPVNYINVGDNYAEWCLVPSDMMPVSPRHTLLDPSLIAIDHSCSFGARAVNTAYSRRDILLLIPDVYTSGWQDL